MNTLFEDQEDDLEEYEDDEEDYELEDDDASEEEDEEALFSTTPREIHHPRAVTEIYSAAVYELADDELKAQFDVLFRFCPCCGRPQRRGRFCTLCTNDVTHGGESAYYMNNGVRSTECIYAKRASWHVLTDHSLIKHRNSRTYQIFGWRLAFIYEKAHVKDRWNSKFYAGVKIDNRRLSIAADPDFVALPEYAIGQVTGLRKIRNIARIFTPAEIHFDPQRPQPKRQRPTSVDHNAPAWYRSGYMTHHYSFFGHDVYIEYEPAERTTSAILRTGIVYGSTNDHLDDLACAQVGDRIGSPFGPKVIEVTRGRKRDVQKLGALHTGVSRGSGTTVVRYELPTIADFDAATLRDAVAVAIRENAQNARPRDEQPTSAEQTLARFHETSLDELIASAPSDPESYSSWGRYLRGHTDLVDALAGLACDLVRCPDCHMPEVQHHGTMPCGRVDECDDDDIPANEPQLALF